MQMKIQLFSGAKGLNFGVRFHQHPYFLCKSSEGCPFTSTSILWNEGTFSLALPVQEVHIIFKWNNLQSVRKELLHLKKHEFCIP